jgi:putative SbcD/Mre11-related phosphoesterase
MTGEGTVRIHTDWLLTPERAAVHVPTATAVIADLHLGYQQVRCRSGEALPICGIDETLGALNAILVRHAVRRLLVAGDLFEDGRGADSSGLRDWLAGNGVELAGVVPGNHDHGLKDCGGLAVRESGEVELGGWRVVHGHGRLQRGRLLFGHFHPCFCWGDQVRAPCYLVGPGRIILPAFSADAAGVDVLRSRRWRRLHCYVIAGEEVLDFGELAALAGRRRKSERRKA